ncbi:MULTISPECIES: response regulator [Tenacibaculum]|uniref:Response regulator n=2 Tax=Tenacibaculum TaxID=104267 RepID=A0AAE9SFW7_9FLAO|nr:MULTISPECIES: response regulator [Tenacibaculum]GFD83448.1 response regulator [Tenacibaculum sp. KUL118]GFD93162.1 response regulator [Alteromonas sp. KUL154]GFD98301.1 response regulator [Alteromonas sp. KUL156]AZJ31489.1 response regulator [Tenacibaculum mesophilum]KAF9657575.1 response regulator [Tenacibaculum mesophilum]
MKKNLNVLLIEDNTIEVMKMDRTVSLLKLKHKIIEAKTADVALEKLNEGFDPDIILLDLNMPKISGIEFLSIIKKNEDFRHIPVIVLTTSNNKKDIVECYKIGISGYILKPLKYEDYITKIDITLSYWAINELKNN